MHDRTRSQVVLVFALALLAACSSDDGSGAGAASPGAGGSSATGGAGAPAATGGRPAGFGGFAPTLGGNPVQGGAATTGGAQPATTGGAENPSEPTLESLNPEELGELCADARASFDASGATDTAGELTCRTAGIFAVVLFEPSSDAELQQLCQETYDECQAEPPDTEVDCSENSTCSATVTEFQACVAEYPEYLEGVAMGLPTCKELTMANLEAALGFQPEPTPACGVLWDKCPESGP